MGVRLETGKQAAIINDIVESFNALMSEKLAAAKLKEFVGHTPLQVFVGALLDQGAAVIIICPMLFSLGTELGLKPLHLGVVMCINLVLGNVTPPFGYNLFTASSITGLKFNEIVKGIFPFLLVEIVLLFVFAYCEPLITWLPTLAGY